MAVTMSTKTKVYRFRLYDIRAEEFKLSARMATQACIRRINAQLIRSSELEIDRRHLDADGMTDISMLIWLKQLLARRPVNVAAVAVAHKTARALWAMITREEEYRRIAAQAA
jgi:hypothetical protein